METLVTKLEMHSADVGKYLDWLARLMMLGVESSGALSAEIIPPSSEGSAWVLMQRFYTPEQIEEWLKSDVHQTLMNELKPYLDSKEVTLSEERDPTGGNISVAVVTRVKPGNEKEYFAFEGKYQSAQARMPGYHGAFVQPPLKNSPDSWTTIIRFGSPQAMDQWFASDERKKLMAESTKLVSSTKFQNVATSFPGWFPSEATGDQGPPNWKTALLILLGLYPSVMLVIIFLMPLLKAYPLALDNFLGNILTVSFTTWISMPLFILIYKAWLFPSENSPRWINTIAIISLIIFFALEVAIFWRYF